MNSEEGMDDNFQMSPVEEEMAWQAAASMGIAFVRTEERTSCAAIGEMRFGDWSMV
jgi:hypothetical protein